MDFFFGGNLVTDIEEAEKANKLASKVIKGTSGSTSLSAKKSRFSLYSLAVAKRFRGDSTILHQFHQLWKWKVIVVYP